MTFLGHVVIDQGVEVYPKNVETVKKWSRPLTLTDIRSFLALDNHYRRFVEGLSTIVAPLTALMMKKAKFELSEKYAKRFERAQRPTHFSPGSHMPKSDAGYVVYCDVS